MSDAYLVEPDSDFSEEQISDLFGEHMELAKECLRFRPTRTLRTQQPRRRTLLGNICASFLLPNTSETLQDQHHLLQRHLGISYTHLWTLFRLLDCHRVDLETRQELNLRLSNGTLSTCVRE